MSFLSSWGMIHLLGYQAVRMELDQVNNRRSNALLRRGSSSRSDHSSSSGLLTFSSSNRILSLIEEHGVPLTTILVDNTGE